MVGDDAQEDPEEPGLHRGTPLEVVDAPVRDQERLLNDVIGRRPRDPEPTRAAPHEIEVLLVDRFERGPRHRAREDGARG